MEYRDPAEAPNNEPLIPQEVGGDLSYDQTMIEFFAAEQRYSEVFEAVLGGNERALVAENELLADLELKFQSLVRDVTTSDRDGRYQAVLLATLLWRDDCDRAELLYGLTGRTDLLECMMTHDQRADLELLFSENVDQIAELAMEQFHENLQLNRNLLVSDDQSSTVGSVRVIEYDYEAANGTRDQEGVTDTVCPRGRERLSTPPRTCRQRAIRLAGQGAARHCRYGH